MIPGMDFWDWLLFPSVVILSLGVAYLYRPEYKALILALPIPSTIAILSLHKAVNADNMLSLTLLLLFTHLVRIIYVRKWLPILPAIVAAAAAYCLSAYVLDWLLPERDGWWFYGAVVWNFLLAAAMLRWFPHRDEEGSRSTMHPALKVIALTGVVLFLLILKKQLGGFMTIFPMVGVVAAYEARNCLYSSCRQIPVVMMTIGIMLLVTYLLQDYFTLPGALAAGWVAFLAVIVPLHRRVWRTARK